MSSTTPPLARRRSATIRGVALVIFALGIVALGPTPPAAAEPGSRTGSVTNQGLRAASSSPDPAVSAVATVRCVSGKAVLITRVTNTGDTPATITIASAWGTKTHAGVAAGATVSAAASIRASTVEAGTVELTVERPSGIGTATAPFAATRCGSSPLAPVGVGANQEIRNQQNTLCLDDIAFDTRPGADVRQWTCQEGQNQLWAVTDLGNGYAEIKNTHSALCLQNIAAASGSGVRQWTCARDDTQQWQLTDLGGGWTEIRNKADNLCVASAASPVDGVLLSQQTCNGSGVQRWRLTDPTVSKMTYTLYKSANPSADEADAYARITDAMDRALARYNRFNNTWRHLNVYYAPGVPTAEASINGDLRFGSNRSYMVEGTALHEISHTVGVGTAGHFQGKCDAQDWPSALPLLKSWDGPDARINCGGTHMWPYGLNYSSEFSETAFDRNVRLVQAMHHDGL